MGVGAAVASSQCSSWDVKLPAGLLHRAEERPGHAQQVSAGGGAVGVEWAPCGLRLLCHLTRFACCIGGCQAAGQQQGLHHAEKHLVPKGLAVMLA